MDQIFYIMIKGTLIATVAGIGVLALKPVFAKKVQCENAIFFVADYIFVFNYSTTVSVWTTF